MFVRRLTVFGGSLLFVRVPVIGVERDILRSNTKRQMRNSATIPVFISNDPGTGEFPLQRNMERDIGLLLDLFRQMENQEKEKNRLRNQFRRQADEIAALRDEMEEERIHDYHEIRHLQEKIKLMKKKIDQFELPQYEWRIENFSNVLRQITGGHLPFVESGAFLHQGRLMCVRLQVTDANQLGLFVHLKKGHADHKLQWPLVTNLVISVVDQSGGPLRSRRDIRVECEFTAADPASQKPQRETNPEGIGNRDIVRVDVVSSAPYSNCDDIVTVQVQVL